MNTGKNQVFSKNQVFYKNLKYYFSASTIEVYSGDLKVGSVEFQLPKLEATTNGSTVEIKQKDSVFICICIVPERAVEKLNSWYRCCMNDCDDHDFIPHDLVQFPDEILYDLPAIKWYSRKDLGTSISDLWNCWEAIQQYF
ncbi:hypothetical protein H012_gp903 [Acanthamoeba polyphaga moumouvirus]|uniref:Uncharacterized protein n=1 Tax=Acanthamoeba polyphaga moumouvirus TaxID=1269028 RepID=L7RC76_9VIRU|nr:hypothetical protein H012_gp903 [Acanthamoeba polyphaga moumouvirus]AGC01563.1 hypothetical protein Moumou_00015 [Acanthamoeba polyphaga moumouvirus]